VFEDVQRKARGIEFRLGTAGGHTGRIRQETSAWLFGKLVDLGIDTVLTPYFANHRIYQDKFDISCAF
jgi:hypothetical protein